MRLYVNIDHVATLREARQTDEPDPVRAADVGALKAAVRGVLNLELAAHDEIVRIACRVQPFQATLVPERRQEITTEGGLALRRPDRKVGAVVRRLTDAGIRVSLFIDPDVATIDRAVELGVPAIEVLNIGHSIVSNAVFWGMEEAVRRMRKLVDEASIT